MSEDMELIVYDALKERPICNNVIKHLDSINDIKNFEKTWPYVTNYVLQYRLSKNVILQTPSYFIRIIPNTNNFQKIKKKRRYCIKKMSYRMPFLPKYYAKGKNLRKNKIIRYKNELKIKNASFIIKTAHTGKSYISLDEEIKNICQFKGSSVESISRIRTRIEGYFIDNLPDNDIQFMGNIIATYYNIIFRMFPNAKILFIENYDHIGKKGLIYYIIKNLNNKNIKELKNIHLLDLFYFLNRHPEYNANIFCHLQNLNVIHFDLSYYHYNGDIVILDKGLTMFDNIRKINKCQVAINGKYSYGFINNVKYLMMWAIITGILVKFPPFTNPTYFFCTNVRNFRIVGTCYLTEFTIYYRNEFKCLGFINALKYMINLESLELYTDKSFIIKNQFDFDWFFETHIKYIYDNNIKSSLLSKKIKTIILRSDLDIRNDDVNIYTRSAMLFLYDSFYNYIPESTIRFTIDYLVTFSNERAKFISTKAPNIKYLSLSKCIILDENCLENFKKLEYFCYKGNYMIKIQKNLRMLIYFPKYQTKKNITNFSSKTVRKFLTKESAILYHYFSTQFRSYVNVYNSINWNYFVFFNDKEEYSKHLDIIKLTKCETKTKYRER
ncbi:Hypothetical protein SRAE_X000227100 [Strongyloides ratti]|uniref:Uncharacterized protein n=1 Tax=Strongyloides ratti TaxID=34506 RepID=A0A090KZ71_STRRB|nr:Hypothetical protein SRAE_X000227100 [Strongyloides ratti]CEF60534.1 Hypothetical protein SRAE_X000227100 [Strongyloides ratti]